MVLDKEAVGPLVARLVPEFEAGPGGASDLAALNLWPERSALPLGRYLDAWEGELRRERPSRATSRPHTHAFGRTVLTVARLKAAARRTGHLGSLARAGRSPYIGRPSLLHGHP